MKIVHVLVEPVKFFVLSIMLKNKTNMIMSWMDKKKIYST